jgi:putative hydrolase of the HAD superfamily
MGNKKLFIDIGGVLMTNGWDTPSRQAAALKFNYNFDEFESKHRLSFSTYELGRLTLDQYLDIVLFYVERPFSRDDFKKFMYVQSKPYTDMIDLIHTFKIKHSLPVIAISNEGKELIEYRINSAKLERAIDFFIISGLVDRSKPDPEIYVLAASLAHAKPQESAYIDDRQSFVDIAKGLGFHAFRHQQVAATRKWLEDWISS